jgi:hypothetical protein
MVLGMRLELGMPGLLLYCNNMVFFLPQLTLYSLSFTVPILPFISLFILMI